MSTRLTTTEFIFKAKQVHGDKYDYSRTVYTRSRDSVSIICPKHGMFEQRAADHLSGSGCPGCQREWSPEHKAAHAASARRSRGMTTDQWVARAKAVHGDRYDYSQVEYLNRRTKVKIICRIHGMFEQNPDSHLRGCGCKKCGNMSDAHKGVHNWSDEQRRKTAATCQARYGASRYLNSDEGKAKNALIRQDEAFRKKMRDIISSDDVQSRTKATCLEKYGVEWAMALPETVDKVHASKRANHSWNTSKPEEDMYVFLCRKFGETDVVRQYKDVVRYPFHCDFYVRSLDLFIELNATWLHGGMWFDASSAECISKLQAWQSQLSAGHRFYEVAIDVWTVRDVKKHNMALQNHLNYLVFWKNDLADFKDWLDSESPLLCNI